MDADPWVAGDFYEPYTGRHGWLDQLTARANPRRFIERYPDCGILDSYDVEDADEIHCLDFWVYLEGNGAQITLEARRDGAAILITLSDDGPGVPPEALSRLGEPFYRPEAARTRETGGAGLGLAIVRSAVVALGGEVEFANRKPHGFVAKLRLSAS